MHRKPRLFPLGYFQVSTTVETFQDLSLPIPGKEDLAKLHSAIYQTVPAKTGACGDNYASQGWIAFIMEYIRRCVPRVGALSSEVCSAVSERQLFLTSVLSAEMLAVPWNRTACGTSVLFWSFLFHMSQLLLFLYFCNCPWRLLCRWWSLTSAFSSIMPSGANYQSSCVNYFQIEQL